LQSRNDLSVKVWKCEYDATEMLSLHTKAGAACVKQAYYNPHIIQSLIIDFAFNLKVRLTQSHRDS